MSTPTIQRGPISWLRFLTAVVLSCSILCSASPAQEQPDTDYSAELAGLDILDPALVEELSGTAQDYTSQGWRAYAAGDFERAAQFYHLVLRRNGGDSDTLYNLACCYGLLGEAELAGSYLQIAVDNGFENAHSLQNDPDFSLQRGNEGFSTLVAGLVAQIEERQAAQGRLLQFPAETFHRARVVYPDDYDPAASYRLVVGLHGFGSNPESFLVLRDRFSSPDFIYICPQGPYAFASSGAVGYSWGGWTNGMGLPVESFANSQAYLDEVIGTMRRTHNINSVYLLGFSQGAMMSALEGLSSPELVDGAILFGGSLWDFLIGRGLLEDHPDGLRWFIAHGNQDTTVPFTEGQALRDVLLAAGHDVTWHEFEGAHAVPEDVVKLAEEWMHAEDGGQ